MGLELDFDHGQTPIEEEEKEGLLIPSIASRRELDEFEQQNIEEAMLWLIGKSLKTEVILTEKFIRDLHRRMYKNVWSWAGEFRRTDKNLGINKWRIPGELRMLCDDTLYWIKNDTYDPDEIAIRFKHRIVSIHCFPNGNGRHSRLMADVIIEKIFRLPVFSWGSAKLLSKSDPRTEYLKALKAADAGNIKPLVTFARS